MYMENTIKVSATVRKQLAAIEKRDNVLVDQRNAICDEKDNMVAVYHDRLKAIFAGKHFISKCRSRDTTESHYIKVLEVNAPYLIRNDTAVTCVLKCVVLQIRTTKQDGATSVNISRFDNSYYAHSDLTPISQKQYHKAIETATAILFSDK